MDLRTMEMARVIYLPLLPVRWLFGGLVALVHPFRTARMLRAWWVIRQSGLFDRHFYLRSNPDVRIRALSPLWHYCRSGWRELRDPAPWFVTANYLIRNSDVKSAGINPFYHYVRFGRRNSWREGTWLPDGRSMHRPSFDAAARSLVKIPTPTCDRPLDNERIAEIGAAVREALYGTEADV